MSQELNIETALMNDLPSFEEVKPLSEVDIECFNEIRDILKKYGALNRFGITLLHKHFDLEEGEMLVEELNDKNRGMYISPRRPEQENLTVLQTAWRLGDGIKAGIGCYQTCVWSPDSNGVNRHSYKHIKAGN